MPGKALSLLWFRRQRRSKSEDEVVTTRQRCFLNPKARPAVILDATPTPLRADQEVELDVVDCTCSGVKTTHEIEAANSNGDSLLQMPHVDKVERMKTNRELTLEFMKCYNNHDLKGARAMITDDYKTVFGEHEMEWEDLAMETQKIFDSFPDYWFSFQKIEERGEKVILHHFIPCGTHTGCAYGFGPYPPIEPTGKYVRNDPEEVHFEFRNGKLCRNSVFSDGELLGPAGIYFQIGGFPMI